VGVRPSGAKARINCGLNGTAEAVPYPRPIYETSSSKKHVEADAFVRPANFPGISVEPYFVKFDGIWEVKGADHLKSVLDGGNLAAS